MGNPFNHIWTDDEGNYIPWSRFQGISCMNCLNLILTYKSKAVKCESRLKTRYNIKRLIQGTPEIFKIIAPKCEYREENMGDISCEVCNELCKFFETCDYKGGIDEKNN